MHTEENGALRIAITPSPGAPALFHDLFYARMASLGLFARSSNPVRLRPRHALPAKKVNSGSFNDYQESMTLRPQICYYCILVHYYQITEEYSDG